MKVTMSIASCIMSVIAVLIAMAVVDCLDVKIDVRVEERKQMQIRTFYVSGPMRGYSELNFPAFDEATHRGRMAGFGIISPAEEDRKLGLNEQTWDNSPQAIRDSVERDCDALLALRIEDGDGIALLDGWEKSTGAVAEVFHAKWLELQPVDAKTYAPFSQTRLESLDLTPIIQQLRRYLGDERWQEYREQHSPF